MGNPICVSLEKEKKKYFAYGIAGEMMWQLL